MLGACSEVNVCLDYFSWSRPTATAVSSMIPPIMARVVIAGAHFCMFEAQLLVSLLQASSISSSIGVKILMAPMFVARIWIAHS
jgi:hypothetical protein